MNIDINKILNTFIKSDVYYDINDYNTFIKELIKHHNTNSINFTFSDHEKLSLLIYLGNGYLNNVLEDELHIVTKRIIKKFLNFSDYKITKLIKEIDNISIEPAWNIETGLLAGKGYIFFNSLKI